VIATATGVDWSTVALPGIDESTVALVLGAGGAIGGATVRALAAMGAHVALATRDGDRSAELAAGVPGEHPVLPIVADLAAAETAPGSVQSAVADVTERLGAPTVLVNCAAITAAHHDFTEATRDEVSAIFEVNVVGTFEAAKAVAPAMRAAGYGRIVNVASIAGMRVSRGGIAYGASKAAVIGLTEQLAAELAPGGITVNCVSPGQTPTKLRTLDEAAGAPQEEAPGVNTAIPLGRRGHLDDYVSAIVFLSSALSGYITGVDIPVEGGVRLVRPKSF
jgi:3-oxoacyl-[acyl-carrier protein] reductase